MGLKQKAKWGRLVAVKSKALRDGRGFDPLLPPGAIIKLVRSNTCQKWRVFSFFDLHAGRVDIWRRSL